MGSECRGGCAGGQQEQAGCLRGLDCSETVPDLWYVVRQRMQACAGSCWYQQESGIRWFYEQKRDGDLDSSLFLE